VIAKRSAESRIAVNDGQTIVIGGLMEDRKTSTVQKVPFLGDIPVLSYIFNRTQVMKTKTELLIFLTPHVAQRPDELGPMSDDEIKGLKLTPGAVQPGTFDEHMRGMQRGQSPQTRPATPISPVNSINLSPPEKAPAESPEGDPSTPAPQR
jgi:type II secretory pathway component GspD/PulD (secretin)